MIHLTIGLLTLICLILIRAQLALNREQDDIRERHRILWCAYSAMSRSFQEFFSLEADEEEKKEELMQ